ncbi:succinate dehydrogenase [Escherichia coli]|uniref:Succinate dehydrogenase n=1 Tax=Escherichia coli TaxID=562 RepID=A0A2A2BYT4_ECOLX|nr:succinate dehydrogenase [Escherichia coli]OTD52339.1 succinate dehydrogenase [Escherichia coli]OTE39652.1 succinate dehydrogenase [Escherichia coli]PAU14609.1 succinate dehydrogenase [Escherichia coli]TFW82963.1 succinate dehydrogenase [Escherichia coli]
MELSKRQIFFHLKFYVFVLTDVYPVCLRNKYKINIYVVMIYFYKLFPA